MGVFAWRLMLDLVLMDEVGELSELSREGLGVRLLTARCENSGMMAGAGGVVSNETFRGFSGVLGLAGRGFDLDCDFDGDFDFGS